MADTARHRRARRSQVGQAGARFGSPAIRQRLTADVLDEEYDEENTGDPTGDPTGPVESATGSAAPPQPRPVGARFGSPALRRRIDAETVDEEQEEHQEQQEPGAEEEQLLAAGPPHLRPDLPAVDVAQDEPLEEATSDPATSDPAASDRAGSLWGAEWAASDGARSDRATALVRPYTRTGGRTEFGYDLRLERLVSATGNKAAIPPIECPEYYSIVEYCAVPRSVAEVAAALSVPLGVARVLLGDLIGTGAVLLHDSGGTAGEIPDSSLLERVLAGLRRL